MGHGSKQMVFWRRKIRLMLGVVVFWFLPIPEFLSWLFVQCGILHCHAARELCFGELMLDISISKFHELIPVVENEDPCQLLALLEQTPSESHLQNSTRHSTLLWGWTDFLNYVFGRLMGPSLCFRASGQWRFFRGGKGGQASLTFYLSTNKIIAVFIPNFVSYMEMSRLIKQQKFFVSLR